MPIPPSVIGTVGPILADRYTHAQLNALFWASSFDGDPPEGNKIDKCQDWLRRANRDTPDTALDCFGRLIAEFMDSDELVLGRWQAAPPGQDPRQRIRDVLGREGLSYQRGGFILGGALAGPSRSLAERLSTEGIQALEVEYRRAYAQVEADPPAALTAACAILEAVCKAYLEAVGQALPSKQVLGTLWSETAAHLGLSPKAMADGDMRQILSGLASITTGVAALRTHRGSAHGHTDPPVLHAKAYRIEPRHARLAVHAAHTMALFVLETWEARRTVGTRQP